MSYVSAIAAPPKGQSRFAAMTSRPLSVALLLVALITATRLTGTVDSDVAWQLWIAGRMHEGANLYRDIIETNPPLWFWMAVPVERVASLLHVRIESALIVAIGCLVALSVTATSRFLRQLQPSDQTKFLCVAAVMLCAMPWMHVGQREQIVMIAALPYVALTAARRDGLPVASLLAAAIGIGAGFGFALKHYFLIVPLLLELWLLASLGRKWRPVRLETLTIAAVGASYAAAIYSFEPEFITRIVPLLQLAYGASDALNFGLLLGPFALVGLVLVAALTLYARYLRSGREKSFAVALSIAAIGFTFSYFIQYKGWPYHTIPMTGFAALALVALMASSSEALPRPLRLAAPVFLAMPLFLAAAERFSPSLPNRDLTAAVAPLRHGDSVGFLSTDTAIAWSVTLQGGYRYPSRYNGFWMLRAIVRDEQLGGHDRRLRALGRQVVSETVADFRCAPPKWIIIERPRPGEDGFDILHFFLGDPAFVELLSHYRPISRTTLEVYELSRPFAADSKAMSQRPCGNEYLNHGTLDPPQSGLLSRSRPRG